MPAADRRRLRGGFDADALAFDRTRPVCPPALFDDLVEIAGLAAGSRVLEIGAGTGQAARPLAERGLAVTAIELGPALAELAREKLGAYDVEVITGSFESWAHAGRPFDAVVACNTLHWIDPEVRYAKPAQVLGAGGHLVVGGCRWALPADAHAFWTEVQEDYRTAGAPGVPPPPPEAIGPEHLPEEALGLFAEVAARRYPFRVVYAAADYVANLSTQTVTKELDEGVRAEFLGRVEARLARVGVAEVTATFVGLLTVGRLR